jgi:N-methylhydantoinase B
MTIDPFTFEVVRDNLASTSEEMVTELLRIAYSPIIRDGHDCGAGVLDARGQLVAQLAGTPGHFNSLAYAAKAMVETFDTAEMSPGDVIMTNDPWVAAGHLNDFLLFTPCFVGDELLAFCATVAHQIDVGGKNPGSTTPNTTDLFQEGLQVPWVKYHREGVVDTALRTVIAANVRLPDIVLADLDAQVAVQARAADRLRELSAKFTPDVVRWVFSETMDRSERLTRAGIRSIRDGTYVFADLVEDDGFGSGPVPLCVAVSVKDDAIDVDFTGSAPQQQGGINLTSGLRDAYVHMSIKCFLDPRVPHNEGCFRPIAIEAPLGSVLNPTRPAAVAGRALMVNRIADLVIGALSQAVPERRMAGYGGSIAQPVFSGVDPRTQEQFIFMDTTAGGLGGRTGLDGETSLSFPYNINHHGVEALEAYYPVRVRQFAIRPNSEGAGRWRGGFGVVKEYEVLSETMHVQNTGDRAFTPAWGFDGGEPSTTQDYFLERAGSRNAMSSKGEYDLARGDVFSLNTPGGGGLEPPIMRDPEWVQQDVTHGYIDRSRALAAYGVVLSEEGELDADATAASRASRDTA